METWIRAYADRHGVDPDTAVKVWKSEGGMNYQSTVKKGNQQKYKGKEDSWGPFQLYRGGGLGNEWEKTYGKDLRSANDATSIQQQIDFAMQNAAKDTWMYGDPENFDLKEKLAALHNTSVKNIVIGEGIDALLGYLCRLFIEPGDKVVSSLGAYPTFNFHVAGYGGILKTVPYLNDCEDPLSLLNLAQESQAKLCYFSNPDNPMGTCHSGAQLELAMRNIKRSISAPADQASLSDADLIGAFIPFK